MVVLDGSSLTCADVAAIGRRQVTVEVSAAAVQRAAAAAAAVRNVGADEQVYGRDTGVGANRATLVSEGDRVAHGLRLARSHVGGAGPLLAPETGLGMLAVRANQLAAGGSGVDPGVLAVLADCVNRGLRPPARRYGGIGTGDLPALAVTVLCLRGERNWLLPDGSSSAPAGSPRFALDPADVLAFMSSNAATLAEAAIATHDLSVLLSAGTVIAALSHLAARASAEAYAEAVQLARPHPGQARVARDLRGLLTGQAAGAARVQDPYAFRALPQVHGAALDAAGHAIQVLAIELNAAAENPLIDATRQRAWHNGNFHTGYLALALDATRAAIYQSASLSAARLGALMDDRCTGLTTFLAQDVSPGSGLMICEYTAHSALAEIRGLAALVTLGGAVLSVGAEEHAGFGTQAARATADVVRPYQVVLACELVAAVRALRLGKVRLAGGPLASAFDHADAALPGSMADRPLDSDLDAAADLLPVVAGVIAAGG